MSRMNGGRGAYRYRVDLPAWIAAAGETHGHEARVVNLSGSGIAVRVHLPIEAGDVGAALPKVGSRLRVVVHDEIGGRTVAREWSGRVVHSRAGVGGGRFGIAFDWPEGAGVRPREACVPRPVVAWPLDETRAAARGRSIGAVALLALLLDQASKVWAGWAVGAGDPLFLVSGLLAVAPAANHGGLGSLAAGFAATSRVVALLGLVALGLWMRREDAARRAAGLAQAVGGGLVVAGLLGNSADRMVLGHVRDFLVSPAFPRWAFNLADAWLVVGAAVLAGRTWTSRRPG